LNRRLFFVALTLLLPACASVPIATTEADIQGKSFSAAPGQTTPPGPISISYRDDVSNVRQLTGVARYGALLGRSRSVPFTVENEHSEQVCTGTFTTEGPNNGKFSLSCFDGFFSGNGTYERKTGDPNDHLVAHGLTPRGLPIILVVGRPSRVAPMTWPGQG